MTKLFYGSYGICVSLALLQLVAFFSAYLTGDLAIYHNVTSFVAGATSLILLASLFSPLKARIMALLIFAVSAIASYVCEMSSRPVDPTRMSFSEGLIQGVLFLFFVLGPILGLVSGASLLRKHAINKEQA